MKSNLSDIAVQLLLCAQKRIPQLHIFLFIWISLSLEYSRKSFQEGTGVEEKKKHLLSLGGAPRQNLYNKIYI